MARQTQGKETQGDYRSLQDIENTKQRLEQNMTKAEFKILEKYEMELQIEKNLNTEHCRISI